MTFADGTFHLPSINCGGFGEPGATRCTEGMDFGNLRALEFDANSSGLRVARATLADCHPPRSMFSVYPSWSLGGSRPDAFNLFWVGNEGFRGFWIEVPGKIRVTY